MFPRNKFWGLFFENIRCFYQYGILSKKCLDSRQKTFGTLVITVIYVFRGMLEEDKTFWGRYSFFSELEQKLSGISVENFAAGLSKLIQRVQRKFLRKRILEKIKLLWMFWNSVKNFGCSLREKNFKTAFYMSAGKVRGNKYVFRKKYNFKILFGPWVKIVQPLVEDFPAGLWNLHSTCPDEHFITFKVYFQILTHLQTSGSKNVGASSGKVSRPGCGRKIVVPLY